MSRMLIKIRYNEDEKILFMCGVLNVSRPFQTNKGWRGASSLSLISPT
jgi:hypothetical protein